MNDRQYFRIVVISPDTITEAPISRDWSSEEAVKRTAEISIGRIPNIKNMNTKTYKHWKE